MKTGRFRYDILYHCIRGKQCVYCGTLATTEDHFQPRSYVTALLGLVKLGGLFTVPACRECNLLAGAKVFCSIGAKRRYVQSRLRVRYKHELSIPNWSEQELEELCPNLRALTEQGLKIRDNIRLRLRWRNAASVDRTTSVKDIGKSSVLRSAKPFTTVERQPSPVIYGGVVLKRSSYL